MPRYRRRGISKLWSAGQIQQVWAFWLAHGRWKSIWRQLAWRRDTFLCKATAWARGFPTKSCAIALLSGRQPHCSYMIMSQFHLIQGGTDESRALCDHCVMLQLASQWRRPSFQGYTQARSSLHKRRVFRPWNEGALIAWDSTKLLPWLRNMHRLVTEEYTRKTFVWELVGQTEISGIWWGEKRVWCQKNTCRANNKRWSWQVIKAYVLVLRDSPAGPLWKICGHVFCSFSCRINSVTTNRSHKLNHWQLKRH